MRPPFLFLVYTAAASVLVPFFAWVETRKLRAAGFPVVRAHEKLGHATASREGSGPLVWFHAASVGESMSVLALITSMGNIVPRAQFLITSGTATSARMVEKHLPPRTIHQFAPLDAAGPVGRFLRHWRPNAAVFVESELWPQMLRRTRDTDARIVLVNARLSTSSRAAWQKRPKTARYVLDVFDLILTQNDEMAQAMVDMHAPADRVARGINLKSLADPLPTDPGVLAPVRVALKGRPVWVAASTHRGEEDIILRVHKALLRDWPDLLLILAPRHPDRRTEVSRAIAAQQLSYCTRSQNELPQEDSVYLADTLGELGNWYALSKVIFLGGSLKPVGGHNPFEVALAGAGVISGPEVFNFAETYNEMVTNKAAQFVEDETSLKVAVETLLNSPEAVEDAGRAARGFVRNKSAQLDAIARRLVNALKLEETNR
ncbi:MAG: 3-deoxy-D-manno-octulosonic acid transferase [Roseobacter sp.]